MCKLSKRGLWRIDPCMENLIEGLNEMINPKKFIIRACCCGHGKYPMTVIIEVKKFGFVELFSGKEIPRKKRYYKKDKQGYYFIPETIRKRDKK